MKTFSITMRFFLLFLAKLNSKRRCRVLKHMSLLCNVWRMYQNIRVNIYHLLSQRKAAQIVKVLLIVHTRPKCTNHMYQTVLNCPNPLINQSKVITWSILNADIEQLIQLIHFCLNVLAGDCGRRESRKCHNFNPKSFWIYVSGASVACP